MRVKEQWLIPNFKDKYFSVLILTENGKYFLGDTLPHYGHMISQISIERANELLLSI